MQAASRNTPLNAVNSLIAFPLPLLTQCGQNKTAPTVHTSPTPTDWPRETLSLNTAQWWEATSDRYLGPVPKALVLEAVAEGVSPQVSQSLASLKKNILVLRAQERLKGKGWLPTVLRPPLSPVEQDDPALMAAE